MRRRTPVGALLIAVLAFASVGSAAQPSPSADLKVTKTDSPDPVQVGAQLTYTITVENLGPSPATGVTVTDNLPSGVDLLSAAGPSGPCATAGSKLTCPIGSLAPQGVVYNGTPVSATVVVVPRRSGTLRNTATVKGEQRDPSHRNDRSTASTRVLPPPTCAGIPATIVGTPGDDLLQGTSGPDVIVGLGGSDRIRAGSGRDLICAGPGADSVAGGTAADRVLAGPGPDRLIGGGGPDVLRGSRGNDVLRGGRGSDRLFGGRGFDRCRGGGGHDLVRGCEGR